MSCFDLSTSEKDFDLRTENHVPSLISHEMKTTLTSIKATLKMLSHKQFSHLSEDGKQLIKIAMGATERLSRLADMFEDEADELPTMVSAADIKKIRLMNAIPYAVEHNQFYLEYQPIISFPDGKVLGFEALARWQHPTQGLISPSTFIPLAEKSGLIFPLGISLLSQACQQLRTWQQHFPQNPPLTMSVNLSSVQLSVDNLGQIIKQILTDYAVNPQTLKLEITESALIQDEGRAINNFLEMKQAGIGIHIDDFGTGYSCISRLQDFPFDALKIDRSFILSKNWQLSEAIFLLASQLQLDVIAEGIETSEHLQFLGKIGCTKMQGYYFSKPMSYQQASHLLSGDTKFAFNRCNE